ncbi:MULTISPECIES: hypothetical protein [Streptosporangium]|uniref:Uncharacterized protein n=1 Tax=Streptosporangium brasiliense TaxID=47480 RepID=A0ABT9R0R4_9ACTN|nr:hypothetical protein [Streptosporangium brasiliense]MDP9862816.1 hypothetical protein [Streptosporangium brasiliense]
MQKATVPKPSAHLVLNYRESRPHGWPARPGQTVGATIGGHTAARDFERNGKSYRISLLPFGQAGDSPHPVYEDVPTDAAIDFKRTLAKAFGAYYSFKYVGGFHGGPAFDVQSYSVFTDQDTSPDLSYGADLYVVCDPGLRQGVHGTLRWIQVARRIGAAGSSESYVDNVGRPNPFYKYGGRTSIYGDQVFNFVYGIVPDMTSVLSDVQFMAEAFLVQDTGTTSATGKAVVNVFAGIKYGWQVQERQR